MAQRHVSICNELEIMYVQNALDAGNEKRKDIKDNSIVHSYPALWNVDRGNRRHRIAIDRLDKIGRPK